MLKKFVIALMVLIFLMIPFASFAAETVHHSFILPLDHMDFAMHVNSQFGPRIHPISGKHSQHNGIDISYRDISEAPIRAVKSGTATVRYEAGGYGHYVTIDHGSVDGINLSTRYAHMSSVAIENGQQVSKGQVIGSVGSTGGSTGPHLHFEVQQDGVAVTPMPYLQGAETYPIYLGHLDTVNSSGISGWARNPDDADTSIDVQIYVRDLGTNQDVFEVAVPANLPKDDVGNIGFSCPIDWYQYPPAEYEVSVHAIDGGHPAINDSPKRFSNPVSTGALKEVNGNVATGWAWNAARPNYPIDVHLNFQNQSDGKVYDYQVPANLHNRDMWYVGNGRHAFQFNIPWHSMTAGSYLVDVYAANPGGAEGSLIGTKTFTNPLGGWAWDTLWPNGLKERSVLMGREWIYPSDKKLPLPQMASHSNPSEEFDLSLR